MLKRSLALLPAATLIATVAVAGQAPSRGPGVIIAPPTLQTLSPTEYFALKQRAFDLVQGGRWADAVAPLETLVAAYPFDGTIWGDLGDALASSGDQASAASAFARAYRFGLPHDGAENAAKAAQAYARAGNEAGAAEWLRVSIQELHYRDPDGLLADAAFDRLRSRPWFLALSGRHVSGGGTRQQQWSADIDAFLDKLSLLRPDLSPQELQRLGGASATLKRRIPSLTDDEMVVELQRLHAMTNRGHSGSPALWEEKALQGRSLKSLPVDFYLFPEGLYVIGAEPPFASLVGSRVVSFASVPTAEALRRTAELIDRDPGSEMSVVWLAPWFLSKEAVLDDLRLGTRGRATITVAAPSGATRSIVLTPGPFRPRPKLYSPAGAARVPLYLQHVGEPFWIQDIDPATTYVQFNQVADGRSETLRQFGLRLRDRLRAKGTSALIVDIRHNNGGNTYLYTELLRTLIAFDAEAGHRLYLITGRNTFSAAQNFAVDVDRLTDAVIVGEPASAPRAGGDEVTFALPFSGVHAGAAPVQWSLQSPADDRVWIAPDVPVTLTAADYFGGRDPVLDTILAMNSKPRVSATQK